MADHPLAQDDNGYVKNCIGNHLSVIKKDKRRFCFSYSLVYLELGKDSSYFRFWVGETCRCCREDPLPLVDE